MTSTILQKKTYVLELNHLRCRELWRMRWNRADLWLWVALHCDSQSVLEVLGQRGRVSCRRHQGSYRTHGRRRRQRRRAHRLFFVWSGGWSRYQVLGWLEKLPQPAEPLPVRSEDETTVKHSSSRRSRTHCVLHTLLAAKLRIWSSGSGKLGPECSQSSSQLRLWHISRDKMENCCRGTTGAAERVQLKAEGSAPVRVSADVPQGFPSRKLDGGN